MRIAYITAYAPFGKRETFILEEMLALVELGVDLTIVPRNPPNEVFHKEGEPLLPRTIRLPLLNWRILAYFLKALVKKPRVWSLIFIASRYSRNLKIGLKNLAIFPKAVFLAELLKKKRINHIHSHWGSTTATIGWVVSQLTDIPYSITLHRWDINENNLLEVKVASAAFVRCIAEDGRRDLLALIGEGYKDKVQVMHMGVRLPEESQISKPQTQKGKFVLASLGDFIPKKGQKFLIEAISLLVKRGVENILCLLIGDGPLEKKLRHKVDQLGLEKIVVFTGRLPHSELLAMWEKGAIDAVVMPSITAPDGDKEGIPVALMEAMAHRIPVIATDTGGIPELLSPETGILVPEKSPEALATAILRLMNDEGLGNRLSQNGFKRIEAKFELGKIVQSLLQLIMNSKDNSIAPQLSTPPSSVSCPFVSVIVPCRNEERFISGCLDSIIAQSYPKEKMEIIVVDGMSEDRTRKIIIEEFTQRFPFIKLLDNPKKSPPCALNIGIKNARGDLIIRMDAHATYPPDYIPKCVKYLAQYDADNVGGIWQVMPRENTLQNKSICFASSSIFGAGDAYYRRGYSGKPKWVDTVFCGCYRKEVFEQIGLFNENLLRAQDLEFNIRLRKAGGKILLVPEIIAYYYPRGNLREFFRHNFKEGIWVTFSRRFVKTPFRLRQYIPLLFVLLLITSAFLSIFFSLPLGSGHSDQSGGIPLSSARSMFLWLFLFILGGYLLSSFYFSGRIAIMRRDIRFFFIMPLTFGARHFGYGLGSIWGLLRLILKMVHGF